MLSVFIAGIFILILSAIVVFLRYVENSERRAEFEHFIDSHERILEKLKERSKLLVNSKEYESLQIAKMIEAISEDLSLLKTLGYAKADDVTVQEMINYLNELELLIARIEKRA